MWKDPIVEEVRKWRDEYAARFNYDLHAICRDLRASQEASGRECVSFQPKRIGSLTAPESQPESADDIENASGPSADEPGEREWTCMEHRS